MGRLIRANAPEQRRQFPGLAGIREQVAVDFLPPGLTLAEGGGRHMDADRLVRPAMRLQHAASLLLEEEPVGRKGHVDRASVPVRLARRE